MSYLDEYNKYKKKKDEEEKTSTNGSYLDEYNKLKGSEEKRTSAEARSLLDSAVARAGTPSADGKNTWFQSGAFDDGYQFGDVTKTIVGTLQDVNENITTAVFDATENLIDTTAYGVGLVGGLFDKGFKDDVGNFIAKEILTPKQSGEAVATYANPIGWTNLLVNGGKTEENSVLGDTADGLVQSASHEVGSWALQMVGVPAWLTRGVNAFGSEIESAFQNDATYTEAAISGGISAGAEIMFGKLSGAIKFEGAGIFDDGLQHLLKTGIKNKLVRTIAKYVTDVGLEGTEEVLTEIASGVGRKMTYLDDKEWNEILSSENLFDAFIGGAVMSGVHGGVQIGKSVKTGRDYTTGLTANEEKVVNKLYEDEVAKQEQNGELKYKEKIKIYDDIVDRMKKGDIDTDTIESVLGGESYKSYTSMLEQETALKNELEALENTPESQFTVKQRERLTEVRKQLSEMDTKTAKSNLFAEVDKLTQKDTFLRESYNEKARRGQAFEADLTKYDAKQQATIQKAIDSGILNNTRRTHEFVDMIAKISADKGVLFDFTNNQKLKESGFAINGKQVNGYVTKDGVTLNLNSSKALDTVVGHEITHILEGTELYNELQTAITKYAKNKGDYQGRLDALTKLYENIKDADVNKELVADLVGDYLFTDADFINNLSTNHRNVFQKIYDEIKYLCKVATAGSQEARELEKVKKLFAEAYKSANKTQTDTKYSVSGINAKTADNSLLLKAEKMLDEGVDSETVRQETGWYKGYDGKWRYEISDNDMDFNINGHFTNPDVIRHRELEYKFITDAENMTEAEIKEMRSLSKALEGVKKRPTKLGDYLKHDELFAAYPELKDVKISFDNLEGGALGAYNIGKNEIVIDNSIRGDNTEIKTTLIHEIQHAIQDIEGFASGSNIDYWQKELDSIISTANSYQAELDTLLFDIHYDRFVAKSEKAVKNNEKTLVQHEKDCQEFKEKSKHGEEILRIEARIEKLEHRYDNISRGYSAYGLYRNTAGEIEARDTANRLNYNAEQRKNTRPDIDKENVVFADDVVKYSVTEPFTDSNGTHYDNAVLLDTDFFDGISPRNWGEKLREMVNKRAASDPFILPIVDENGNTTLLQFANSSDRVFTDGASNHRVLDKLSSSSDNISKLAVVHIDEIVSVSEENSPYYTTENKHQWLDKNGWLHRNANVINQKNGNIYNLTMDIAKSSDGRTILYATNGKIKKVGTVQVNSLKIKGSGQNPDFSVNLPQDIGNVKPQFSLPDSNGKTLYTGSPVTDIQQFKVGGADGAKQTGDRYGRGVYLTTNKTTAQGYAGDSGRVYEINADALNIFNLNDSITEEMKATLHRELNGKDKQFRNSVLRNFRSEKAFTDFDSAEKFFDEQRKIWKEEDGYYSANKPEILSADDKTGKAVIEYTDFANIENAIGNLDGNQLYDALKSISTDDFASFITGHGFDGIAFDEDEGNQQYVIYRNEDRLNILPESKTKYSLSEQGEDIAPVGKFFGKDMALENAPVAENAKTGQTVPKAEDIAPVMKEADSLEAQLYRAEQALESLDKETESLFRDYAEQKISDKDFETKWRELDKRYAPVRQEQERLNKEITEDENQRFASLDDADVPPEMDAPYYGEAETVEPVDPFAERDMYNVGKKNVKAYMHENPEVKPYFQQAAREMLGDLYNGVKGERTFNEQLHYESGGEKGWMGTKRHTTEDIASLLDDWGYTYDQIEEGLNAIIEDNGKENNAVSKRIEFMLDNRLRNGYTGLFGEAMPRNDGYVNLLKEMQLDNSRREAFDSFMETADQYAPPEDFAPMKDEPVFKGEQNSLDGFEQAEDKPERTTRAKLYSEIIGGIKSELTSKGYDFDKVLDNARRMNALSINDNTPQRVNDKTFGYEAGEVLNDLTFNKVALNESEGLKWLNKQVKTLRNLSKKYKIKPDSKGSIASQMYAEGFWVNKENEIIAYGDAELAKDFPDVSVQNRIKALASDQTIRKIYDDTLSAINASRARNGYPEIPRLDNYFLHFRAMDDTFSRLGLPFNPNDIKAKDLPTDINGMTVDRKPGQPFFTSAMHREGKRTSFDLLGGLEKYLNSAKNQIYHIDDIQTIRALWSHIAERYGQAHGLENLNSMELEAQAEHIQKVYDGHLSNYARFLNEYANNLAGKTALIDRGIEGLLGRRALQTISTINSQVGKNQVGFNVSSASTNFIPLMEVTARLPKQDVVKAFAQTVSNKFRKDGFVENNPALIRRKGADKFSKTPWEKVSDTGYVLMSAVDNLTSEVIVRSKYNELTRKGMDSKQAHIRAGEWAMRVMGDRSYGQMPMVYNSKVMGLVTKYQLEVRNALDSMFYDTFQEAKASTKDIENQKARNAATAAKYAFKVGEIAVLNHLFGTAFEKIAGYNPAFDIVSTIMTLFGLDDEDEEDTFGENAEQAFQELLGDLPYASLFTGGGRIPISSALPIEQFVSGKDEYGNEKSRWETIGETLPYYLLPGGYGQIKKTYQGLKMFDDDLPISGSYTDSGNLRYPVEKTFGNVVQAGLFGQYASENARDYFDNERSPLKEKQIQEFIDVDIPISDYWEYREGLAKQETLEDKFDYIADLDLPVAKKNILINNIVDRKDPVDLENYDDFSNYEEFDFAVKNPEKYQFLTDNGVTVEEYKNFDDDAKDAYDWAYQNPEKYIMSKSVCDDVVEYRTYAKTANDFEADKDENGKSISGSKKAKVVAYIDNLPLDYGQKCILFRSFGYKTTDADNRAIVEYLDSREDITYEEMVTILTELDFTVNGNNVYWD